MSQPPPYPVDQTKQGPAPDAPLDPQLQPPPQQLYPQPGTVYYAPAQPQPYGPQQFVPGQPQQPIVVMGSNRSVQSYAGHIAFAGCSCCCCCGVFGIVALVLAILANNRAGSQPDSARSLGRWSIAVSIINIIIGLIIFIVVIVWYVLAVASVYSEILEGFERNQTQLSMCRYRIDGRCFASKESPLGYMSCRTGGYYNSVDRYCYFN